MNPVPRYLSHSEVWATQIIGQIISGVWKFKDSLGKWCGEKHLTRHLALLRETGYKVLDLFALFLNRNKTTKLRSLHIKGSYFILGEITKGRSIRFNIRMPAVWSCSEITEWLTGGKKATSPGAGTMLKVVQINTLQRELCTGKGSAMHPRNKRQSSTAVSFDLQLLSPHLWWSG